MSPGPAFSSPLANCVSGNPSMVAQRLPRKPFLSPHLISTQRIHRTASPSPPPVVDAATGKLYVPFLHFSNADQDFIQMLISDDAGQTFHFATFNIPGAPNPTVMPVTQPGELTACGGTNIRLTIHGTANPGPGRFGFPRYINASRLTLQPAMAARNGTLFLAWSNSTSPFLGDPAGHS